MFYSLTFVTKILQKECRLVKGNSWVECSVSDNLQKNLLLVDDPDIFYQLYPDRKKFSVGQQSYYFDPKEGEMTTLFGRNIQQDPSVVRRRYYVLYAEIPSIPDREQLVQVITGGDDSQNNVLVLDTEGRFSLRSDLDIVWNGLDATVAVRSETFIAGNGYVGITPTSREVDENYNMFLEGWIMFLKSRRSDVFMDYPSKSTTTDLLQQLEEIRTNWQPDC